MEIFNNNDKQYFDWMLKNPKGFVVNTTQSCYTSYFVLHKSGCRHITLSTGLKAGAFTERSYIKICSNDLNEIILWFRANNFKFKGAFKECKSCIQWT